MHIWVDADACPAVIREILVKAARRTQVPLTFVANQHIPVPPDKHIQSLRVAAGFDVADDEIVERVQSGDIVITSDIPLASDVLQKNANAMTTRGDLFDKSSIKSRLIMRDFMDTMRASGEHTGGPKTFSQRDKQNFANQLDRLLAQR